MHWFNRSRTSTGKLCRITDNAKTDVVFHEVSSSMEVHQKTHQSSDFIYRAIPVFGREVYSVKYLTPSLAASSAMMCTVSAPA